MQIAATTRAYPGEFHHGDGYCLLTCTADGNIEECRLSPATPKRNGDTVDTIELKDSSSALLAVIDGTGHGEQAAEATQKILACVHHNRHLELEPLVRECHQVAYLSRGAAIGIVRVDVPAQQLRFIGVGDIRMQIGSPAGDLHPPATVHSIPHGFNVETYLSNNGIVGYRIPTNLQVVDCAYRPGHVVALHSDGITSKFGLRTMTDLSSMEASAVVESVMAQYRRSLDDATVVVLK